MLCRGFSLRILVDIYTRGSMTFSQILSGYGGGQGMEWMLKKRIGSMQSVGLVEFEDQILQIKSPRGTIVGIIGNLFKKVLKMGKGG